MEKINFENLPSTNTPISAENLNKIQINVENEFENINKKIEEKNYISVSRTSNYTIATTNNVEVVPFTNVVAQAGDKLSLSSDGKIVVGPGVEQIKLSLDATLLPNTTSSKALYIFRNENNVRFVSGYGAANFYSYFGVHEHYISVQEGDKISVRIYGNAGEVFDAARSGLSIKAVKYTTA